MYEVYLNATLLGKMNFITSVKIALKYDYIFKIISCVLNYKCKVNIKSNLKNFNFTSYFIKLQNKHCNWQIYKNKMVR